MSAGQNVCVLMIGINPARFTHCGRGSFSSRPRPDIKEMKIKGASSLLRWPLSRLDIRNISPAGCLLELPGPVTYRGFDWPAQCCHLEESRA